MLTDLLSAHDYYVSYGRALVMETALANAVVESIRECTTILEEGCLCVLCSR